MPRWALVVAAAVVALLPGGARSQEAPGGEAPPAFPTAVEQVTVDVVVMDGEGQPVTDLAAGDFEVYENGVRQAATSFELFDVGAAPAISPPAPGSEGPSVRTRVSSNADEAEGGPGRTFVLFFDDAHLTADTADRAKRAAADFVTSATREGDRVTLVAPGTGTWWSTRMESGRAGLLEMLEAQQGLLKPDMQPDRLTDYEAMRVHIFRDRLILEQIQRHYRLRGMETAQQSRGNALMDGPDPYILAKAAGAYAGVTARNELTLRAMKRSLEALVQHQGRKSLILVSEGFINDPELGEFREILNASRRANTAIYFLNSRGLRRPSRLREDQVLGLTGEQAPVFSDEYQNSGGSVSLARDSGGFIMRDSDEFAVGLTQIADETSVYYLIGYNPTDTARDGQFREIEVRLPGRKGLSIRARKGYYAPAEDPEPGEAPAPDADLQAAMDSPYAARDLGLRMTHFFGEETDPGTARVEVVAELDVSGVRFESRGGEEVAHLQLALVVMNRADDEHFRYDQELDLKLTPEMRAALAVTGLPIVRDFDLVPGRYRAKIVVKDRGTSRLGTLTHDLEVPEIDRLRLRVSTPVLSDMRAPPEQGRPGQELAKLARRDFVPAATLYLQFDVYGAARLEGSGLPRVSAAWEVRRSDGQLYTRGAPGLLEPGPDGGVSHSIGFPLRAAPAGLYEVSLRVRDLISGQSVRLREPFRVSVPPAPVRPAAP